jgi:2-(1,2-epoxy-1,2-dihydrophenyl)acetyl-CoA isomerase
MTDDIRTETHDGWRKLVLNRPDKLNAVNAAMLARLLAALDAAEQDAATRALLLTGEGRGFCAGQELGPDVTPGPNGPPDLEQLAGSWHHEVVRRIRASRLPVVCAVNGVAAGAGASFALACDIVLAARSAKFVQAFVKIGLVPDSGASFFLTHAVGEARARALAMLGEPLDAERAEAWGMIWKVVDDAALQTEAETITASLAKAPSAALARMKQMFAAAGTNSLTAQLDLEARLQGEAGRSGDFAEGSRAFQE